MWIIMCWERNCPHSRARECAWVICGLLFAILALYEDCVLLVFKVLILHWTATIHTEKLRIYSSNYMSVNFLEWVSSFQRTDWQWVTIYYALAWKHKSDKPSAGTRMIITLRRHRKKHLCVIRWQSDNLRRYGSRLGGPYRPVSIQHPACAVMTYSHQWPVLLSYFNYDPSMDK